MAFYGPNVFYGILNGSDNGGFEMIASLKMMIKQNLKMLLLTNPGERVFDPNFGVGIRQYLFEMVGQDDVYAEIDSKIKQQVALYMPYLKITRVQFNKDLSNENKINIKLVYSVPRISLFDELNTEIL
jgi:phage baseplate assembly protein W